MSRSRRPPRRTGVEHDVRPDIPDSANSPSVEPELVERVVLEEILDLHPEHLTIPELVLRIVIDSDRSEEEEVRHAVRDLMGSGVLRCVGDLVAPTHAALRAAVLLDHDLLN